MWCSSTICSRPPSVILYTAPLSKLISSSSVDHHLYADDTQLFISFSPHSIQDALNHIRNTINQISAWMTTNLLCLNPSKTELLIIGLREQLSKLTYSTYFQQISLLLCLTLLQFAISESSLINNLTFADRITKLSQICYMYMNIRDLRRLRPILDYQTACTIATSIIHSKLDYCNSLFYSIISSQIGRLQTIQNTLARVPNITT